jgi:hypothetical protein
VTSWTFCCYAEYMRLKIKLNYKNKEIFANEQTLQCLLMVKIEFKDFCAEQMEVAK